MCWGVILPKSSDLLGLDWLLFCQPHSAAFIRHFVENSLCLSPGLRTLSLGSNVIPSCGLVQRCTGVKFLESLSCVHTWAGYKILSFKSSFSENSEGLLHSHWAFGAFGGAWCPSEAHPPSQKFAGPTPHPRDMRSLVRMCSDTHCPQFLFLGSLCAVQSLQF